MRVLILSLALFAAACDVNIGKNHAHGGYSVQIRANGEDQIYVVTAPDGRMAAARAHEGVSAILNAHDLQQAIATMPAPQGAADNGQDHVSIHGPGFSLQASGDDHSNATPANTTATTTAPSEKPAATSEHDRGHVTMNIGGFGMNVDADDGPGGEDRANVQLTGLSAHDARHFINDAHELSPDVKSQMLTALGLPQDDRD